MSTVKSLAQNVVRIIAERRFKVATAESCTGGQLASLLTEIEGYSHCVECAFVTYSDKSKTKLLGVPESLIRQHGPVSEEVASKMVLGAIRYSDATLAISLTGFAGPGGPSDVPGLVYLALADARGIRQLLRRQYAETGRDAVRQSAINDALHMLLSYLLHSSVTGSSAPAYGLSRD